MPSEKLSVPMLVLMLLGLMIGLGSFAVATRAHHRACSCEMQRLHECPPHGP